MEPTVPYRPVEPDPFADRHVSGDTVLPGDMVPPGVPVPPGARGRFAGPRRRSAALGVADTSGVQVRLRRRGGQERKPAVPAPPRRRGTLVAAVAGAVGAVALVAGGMVILQEVTSQESGGKARPLALDGASSSPRNAALPRTGPPVEVRTAGGSRYRVAAVRAGTQGGATSPQRSSPPSGATYVYIEYVLANPSDRRVLLDFPGDVFVRRDRVPAQARGRCVWQAGVPGNMCTPPTRSAVVRRLAGGEPVAGEGDDRYLPPGSSYLVRATVQMPVDRSVRREDVRLYIWRRLYVAAQSARYAPLPSR